MSYAHTFTFFSKVEKGFCSQQGAVILLVGG